MEEFYSCWLLIVALVVDLLLVVDVYSDECGNLGVVEERWAVLVWDGLCSLIRGEVRIQVSWLRL